jgi:hypothetical protein
VKGKNYSRNNESGKRRESDLYRTHPSMVEQFLDAYQLWDGMEVREVLEPCCGEHDISKVLEKRGYSVTARDISMVDGYDFLLEKHRFQFILTNPPYSLAFEFIQQCKKVAEGGFALLLPITYLQGKQRFDHVWTDTEYPLEKVFVFTRYPMLGPDPRPDGKYPTGMACYGWFVWNSQHRGPATIDWLDNDKFVLRKKDCIDPRP